MDQPIQTRKCFDFGCKYAEPALVMSIVSENILGVIMTNLIEMQYCHYYLDIHDENVCLDPTVPHFADVQNYVTKFETITMTFASILPAAMLIFMGPWSDVHGRRPLIMCCSAGLLITFSLLTWGVYARVNPYFFLLFEFPLSLSGGGALMCLAIYCYLSDQTTVDERVFRLGILQCICFIGTAVGTLVAPYLRSVSYTFALFTGTCICSILNLYVFVFLKESLPQEALDKTASRNPIRLSSLKSIYETCYANQSSSTVKILVAAGSFLLISSVVFTGENYVLYLYLQKVFGWTMESWTHLQILIMVVSAILVCALTNSMLRLGDLQVIVIVVGLRFFSTVLIFLSGHTWVIYAAGSFGGVSEVTNGCIRSYLSKIFNTNEIGKVYALCGLLEAMSPFFGSLTYNPVYRKTIELGMAPNLFFLISIFLCVLMEFQTAIIAYLNKRRPSIEPEAKALPAEPTSVN